MVTELVSEIWLFEEMKGGFKKGQKKRSFSETLAQSHFEA